MKQGAYVLLIILIVAFVVSGVFSSNRSIFPVVNWWNSLFNRTSTISVNHSETVKDSYSSNINSIKIDLVSADLIISKENVSDVEIDYQGNGELVVSERNRTLTIKEEFKSWNLGSVSKGKLVVKIPGNLTTLETKTISGDTSINAIVFEKLVAESISGKIELEDLLADDLIAKSISGRIDLENTAFREGYLKNVSGRVNAKVGEVWEELTIETVSGRIALDLSEGITPNISFTSVSGELDSRVTGSNLNCYLKIKTVSGDAKVTTR